MPSSPKAATKAERDWCARESSVGRTGSVACQNKTLPARVKPTINISDVIRTIVQMTQPASCPRTDVRISKLADEARKGRQARHGDGGCEIEGCDKTALEK